MLTLLYIRNVNRKKMRKEETVEIKSHVIWPFGSLSFLSILIVLCIGVPLIGHFSQEPTFDMAAFWVTIRN